MSRGWIFRAIQQTPEWDFEGYDDPQEMPSINDRVLNRGSRILYVEGCIRGYLQGSKNYKHADTTNTSNKDVIRKKINDLSLFESSQCIEDDADNNWTKSK